MHAKDLQRWPGPGTARARLEPIRPGAADPLPRAGPGGLDWPAIVSTLLDEGYSGCSTPSTRTCCCPGSRHQATLGVLRGLLPAGPAEGRTW